MLPVVVIDIPIRQKFAMGLEKTVILSSRRQRSGTSADCVDARLLELGESLVAVVLDSLDEGIVRCQRSKGATHVRVDNLQAVDVAGIDPTEPIILLVSLACRFQDNLGSKEEMLTLPWPHP